MKKNALFQLIKEKKNKKGNTSSINLNEILFDIAKLKNDISTDITTEPLITSYKSLETIIDEINTKIDEFKKTLIGKSYNAPQQNILNKLGMINDFMKEGNYQSIVDTSFYFVKEAIPTDNLREVVKDVTHAFHKELNIIKGDIQKNRQENYNKEIKIKMENLISDYKENINKFKEFESEINKYIKELEILYEVKLPAIILMIDDQTIKEPHLIIINENENVISQDINKLYDEIIESDGSVSEIDMIIPTSTGISQTTTTPKALSVSSKYYKKFINNSDYKKNIINLHKYWLKMLKNYKNKLEHKILIGGSPPSSSNIVSTSPFQFDDLIKLFIEYEDVVRKFKILSNNIIKLVKKYNVRYVQFIHFQNWILKYMEITITNGEYTYFQYVSHEEILTYHTILNTLKNRLNNFNDTNASITQFELSNIPIYKWFYKNHYFIIYILENFFKKLLEYWEINDKDHKKLIKTANEDDIISNYFFLFNIFYSTLENYRTSEKL